MLLGSGTVIGSNCFITNSVIGPGCHIGEHRWGSQDGHPRNRNPGSGGDGGREGNSGIVPENKEPE